MYAELVKDLIRVAKENGASQKVIDDLLDRQVTTQERMAGVRGTTYREAIEGAFNMGDIVRIQRKHDKYSISNKIFDFTSRTIQDLLKSGYEDTIDQAIERFGIDQVKASGIKIEDPNSQARLP
jgi:glutamate 5-kinase